MRCSLKITVKCLLVAGCVFLFAINFYNWQIWMMENRQRSLSQDFDLNLKHPRLSKLLIRANVSDVNETLEETRPNEAVDAPVTETTLLLWPDKDFYDNDRILNQLRYKQPRVNYLHRAPDTIPPKKILAYSGLEYWDNIKAGRKTFLDQKCLVNSCTITEHASDARDADAILFVDHPEKSCVTRPAHQIWIYYMMESPAVTPSLRDYAYVINLTATYRHDSDIVVPYGKLVPYDANILTLPQGRNFATGKTKKVAWFVSNCGGARNGRMEYAEELSKYIKVDIHGQCGEFNCPRRSSKCYDMLKKDYKFYLAFENSNCRDYITEKFFVNSLQNDIIPVVMGAAPEDYRRVAPPHSFIHVDDFDSPKELAEYLNQLDQNDDLYNEYFQWKGAWYYIDTLFWCRVCAMLHKPRDNYSYRDLERWWNGPDICIGKEKWRNKPRKSKFIADNFDSSPCGSLSSTHLVFFYSVSVALAL